VSDPRETLETSQQKPRPAEPDSAFFPSMTSTKEKKTAEELAAMIVADLSEVTPALHRSPVSLATKNDMTRRLYPA
jgi:hypothetical protein